MFTTIRSAQQASNVASQTAIRPRAKGKLLSVVHLPQLRTPALQEDCVRALELRVMNSNVAELRKKKLIAG